MNLVRLKAELAAAETCSVLSAHIIDMAKKIPNMPDNVTAIDGMNLINKWFLEAPHVGYFDVSRDKIVKDAKVPSEQVDVLFNNLDLMARTYVMYGLIPLIHEDVIDSFEDLKKIEKVAQKLKDLLPEKDSTLYTILAMVEQTQSHANILFDEKTNAAAIYFTNLNVMVDSLLNIRSIIPQTVMGQFMKLGVKSPKGNLGLKVWLEQAHSVWTGYLQRCFKHDGESGVNGRKRFTEFAYNILIIIHPEMKYASVENGVRVLLDPNSKTNVLLPPKVTS
jgi:hypothetical protein